MMKSMQFSWSMAAWICCTHLSPRLWCIRLYCAAPLPPPPPRRQWWIWFISMVASSAHSHSAGWQWQTEAGSPQICLLPGQHSRAGEGGGGGCSSRELASTFNSCFSYLRFTTDLELLQSYLFLTFSFQILTLTTVPTLPEDTAA